MFIWNMQLIIYIKLYPGLSKLVIDGYALWKYPLMELIIKMLNGRDYETFNITSMWLKFGE